MSILETLNTCNFNGKTTDPVTNRRNSFISSLRNQISSLKSDDFEIKRPWYRTDEDGLKGSLRFSNKPIDLGDGRHYFLVKDKEELIDIFGKVLQETNDKEFDEILENHVSTFNRKS